MQRSYSTAAVYPPPQAYCSSKAVFWGNSLLPVDYPTEGQTVPYHEDQHSPKAEGAKGCIFVDVAIHACH